MKTSSVNGETDFGWGWMTLLPAGFLVTDSRGVILEANEAGARALGRKKASDTVGRKLREGIASGHERSWSLFWRKAVREGEAETICATHLSALKESWVRIKARRAHSDRRGIRMMVFCEDVTERMRGERSLSDNKERYRLLVQTAGNVIIFISHGKRVLEWNGEAERVFGIPQEDAVGKSYPELLYGADRRSKIATKIHVALRSGRVRNFGDRIAVRDGGSVQMLWNLTRVEGAEGRISGVLVIGQDVTALSEARTVAERSEARLRSLFQHSPDIISEVDEDGKFYFMNRVLSGYDMQKVIGSRMYDYVPASDHAKIRSALQTARKSRKVVSYETSTTLKGETHGWSTRIVPLLHRKRTDLRFLVIATDITTLKESNLALEARAEELRQANESLKFMAVRDVLTGLLNRRGMEEILAGLIRESGRAEAHSFALLLDLDNFKDINQTFGFSMGDAALQRIAAKIHEAVRPQDAAGRIGGDEFLILLPKLKEAEAMQTANRLCVEVSEVVMGLSRGEKVRLTASIGMVRLVSHSDSLEELVERAFVSLGQSKSLGKNTVTYRGKCDLYENSNGGLLTKMLDERAPEQHFYALRQPIFKLAKETIVGYEFLSRLKHDTAIGPKDFFRLAMESRILTYIDRVCMKTCIRAARDIEPRYRAHINLYPTTLIEIPVKNFCDDFDNLQRERQVYLELSEQQILGDPARLAQTVNELRKAGFKIALDDVGFGSSCLESLILLEPEVVKIDLSCIRGIAQDLQKVRSLKRLLKVIDSVESQAIAEGIESAEDLELLRELGVPYGQGFLFGVVV